MPLSAAQTPGPLSAKTRPSHLLHHLQWFWHYRGYAAEGLELTRCLLAREGGGVFRIPRTLAPGIYFLRVGEHRFALNHIP